MFIGQFWQSIPDIDHQSKPTAIYDRFISIRERSLTIYRGPVMYEIKMQLPFNNYHVDGTLTLPISAQSLIIFSHGYGKSSLMNHEHKLAKRFQKEGFATLVFDMLDNHNEIPDNSRDLKIYSNGLLASTNWLHSHSEYSKMDLAYFGSGTGAAVALKTASMLNKSVKAMVSLSGRLDLAKPYLPKVKIPTLLIAGELDFQIVNINKYAIQHLNYPKQLAVIPGASRLFEESDKLNEAARISTSWYKKYIASQEKTEVIS